MDKKIIFNRTYKPIKKKEVNYEREQINCRIYGC